VEEVLAEALALQNESRRAAAQQQLRDNARKQEQTAGAAGRRERDDAAKFATGVSCPATDTAAIARCQATTCAWRYPTCSYGQVGVCLENI
jgi:hypothetical protein